MAPSEGVAGAAARAIGEDRYEGEAERRRERVGRRPVLGRLRNFASGPNNAGESYLKGAVGEEKLGAVLDTMTNEGLFVLHDRRRPGRAANIDHLVVAPSGVWVIDAKRYRGLITKVDRGGWFTSDVRLMIDGRDRTRLVTGVQNQVADVHTVLHGADLPATPVHGALCFIDGEFRLLARPFEIDSVLITWGKALRERLRQPGDLDQQSRQTLHTLLAGVLRPAT